MIDRRDWLRRTAALSGGNRGRRPQKRVHARQQARRSLRTCFRASRPVKVTDVRRDDQCGRRRQRPATAPVARRAADARHLAPGRARPRQGLHRRRRRSARLRRQQQARRRTEPRQLLEARHGAGSDRGDEALRLRSIRRRRPRPRRAGHAPPDARSSEGRHEGRGAGHRADALPVHPRRHERSPRRTTTGSS